MLRQLFAYTSSAATFLVLASLMSFVGDLCVASRLSRLEYGHYHHYILVMAVCAGPFTAGIDHTLVTFINRRKENYAPFLRLLFLWGAVVTILFLVIALVCAPFLASTTVYGVGMVGPFVFVTLGLLVFRARLEKRYEFGCLLLQSGTWSLGCLILIWRFPTAFLPIMLNVLGLGVVTAIITLVFLRRLRADPRPIIARNPQSAEYGPFWSTLKPLWIAGMAFFLNSNIVSVVVDIRLGVAELGLWRFVFTIMMFIYKPIQLVQRAVLPVFTLQENPDSDEFLNGFRKLVRLNLIIFPILAIGILALFPLLTRIGDLYKYESAWPLLAIVIVVTPIIAVEFLVASVSMALDFPRNNRDANVVSAIINVPVAVGLVYILGIDGAAWASVFYGVCFCFLMFRFAYRDIPEFVRFAAKYLILSVLWLSAAIGLMAWSGRPTMTAIPAAAFYIVATYVTGIWSWDHVVMAWEHRPRFFRK